MPSNNAAWLQAAKTRPLVVKEAPYVCPGPDEIVIKVRALAVNPIDRIKQELGDMLYGHIKYPFVLGYDIAGEVFELGKSVARFGIGNRVVAFAVGMEKAVNASSQSAFQEYVVVRADRTSQIPDGISFEQAAVLPLGMATAACALFMKNRLALQLPCSPRRKSTGKTILIWGGSTSVGTNAIQLAIAAGYDVITTCSPRNFELVKKLGAKEAFDYNSKTIVNDIIGAFKGRTSVGALAIGNNSAERCLDVLHHCKGERKIMIASFPLPEPFPKSFILFRVMFAVIPWMISIFFKSTLRSTKATFFTATEIMGHEIESEIFVKYLHNALALGEFVCAPEPQVIGKGLEHVQEALDILGKGVSAKKIVVTL
jgi:NADPH:quinone reductase-like Zn-dependent oxidoreductase